MSTDRQGREFPARPGTRDAATDRKEGMTDASGVGQTESRSGRGDVTAWARAWWWPAFAFVYPLLWAPWSNMRAAAYTVHIGFAIVALAGALALEGWTRRDLRLTALARSAGRLLVRPPVAVAFGFMLWAWVAALASPQPGPALTGSLTEYSNGAYEFLLLFVLFTLVYAGVRRDPKLAGRIALAVVASGAVLAILALVEVLSHHALMYKGIAVRDLPMVSFPQKGHLAGMLALATGTALGTGVAWIVLVIAAGIGLTVNRAASLALLPAIILARPVRIGRIALMVLAVVAGLGLGTWVAKQPQSHVSKRIVSDQSLKSRAYLYLAAVRGIAARPVTGWGGGVFEMHWTDFLSLDELSGFAKAQWGAGPVVKVLHSEGSYPVLIAQPAPGAAGSSSKVRIIPVTAWHSHNQFLEIGLQSGLVGLLLYLTLLAFGLRGLRRGNPLSLGLLTYFIFLQLWFVIPETRGLLWVVWAAAIASSEPRPAAAATAAGTSEAGPETA